MIRVKIEIVPHGRESEAEVLDTVLIANDGTLPARGEDEGGVGNYEVYDNETLGHLHVARSPEHRLFLAEQALGIVQDSRKLDAEGKLDGPRKADPRPVRTFGVIPAKMCPAKECLDPSGYCANGDCLAAN